jgi:hypothetical protein
MGGRGAGGGGGRGGGGGGYIRKGNERSSEEALMSVNKDNYYKGHGYQVNCQRCIWAYELQRRGYDVEALPNNDGLGSFNRWHSIVDGNLQKEFLGNPFGRGTNKLNEKEATSIMAGWGEGSRGVIQMARKGGSGHVFNVEYKNGKITVFEAQTGERFDSLAKYLSSQKAMPGYVQLFRTDNLKFKASEYPKYVKQRGK